MSGYLQRSKGNKKHWKRLWFVIKNKVLYTYAASEVFRLSDLCWIFTVQLGSVPVLPFRMLQLWRVNLCWAFSWERRRTGPLRNFSSSCITKIRCFTFSRLMTSRQHKGIWILYCWFKKKKKSTQPRALYLFPCVFHVTKSWLFHLSVGNKFTIALRVFSPLFKSSDWKCKTLKRILNVMYFTHLCWCFLSLGGLKPSKRRWFLNSNLVSQHHRASSWTTYDPWLDLRSVVTSSGRTPVARLF